eukprot:NODE_671_length_1993_cov_63.654835_g620_i0.p1 GENE.NODE_671_length_1993_cov_63.654835_g620_i0~~NODE_671_length_1993_cov_63.654835_g620_i0.p1  ORF type:complete len:600 (+),score=66.34 NODE_671_length_1993_cov_63.654835_g620_i0:64-1800(+)
MAARSSFPAQAHRDADGAMPRTRARAQARIPSMFDAKQDDQEVTFFYSRSPTTMPRGPQTGHFDQSTSGSHSYLRFGSPRVSRKSSIAQAPHGNAPSVAVNSGSLRVHGQTPDGTEYVIDSESSRSYCHEADSSLEPGSAQPADQRHERRQQINESAPTERSTSERNVRSRHVALAGSTSNCSTSREAGDAQDWSQSGAGYCSPRREAGRSEAINHSVDTRYHQANQPHDDGKHKDCEDVADYEDGSTRWAPQRLSSKSEQMKESFDVLCCQLPESFSSAGPYSELLHIRLYLRRNGNSGSVEGTMEKRGVYPLMNSGHPLRFCFSQLAACQDFVYVSCPVTGVVSRLLHPEARDAEGVVAEGEVHPVTILTGGTGFSATPFRVSWMTGTPRGTLLLGGKGDSYVKEISPHDSRVRHRKWNAAYRGIETFLHDHAAVVGSATRSISYDDTEDAWYATVEEDSLRWRKHNVGSASEVTPIVRSQDARFSSRLSVIAAYGQGYRALCSLHSPAWKDVMMAVALDRSSGAFVSSLQVLEKQSGRVVCDLVLPGVEVAGVEVLDAASEENWFQASEQVLRDS